MKTASAIAISMACFLSVAARAEIIGVRLVEDESLNAEARLALTDFGVENAETARVLRMYLVYDEATAADQFLFSASVRIITLSPFHSFFNHPLGDNLPPNADDVANDPALEFDTFFTINITMETGEPLIGPNAGNDSISNDLIAGGSGPTLAGFAQDVSVPSTPLGEGEVGALVLQMTLLGAECQTGIDEFFLQWPVYVAQFAFDGTESATFQYTGDRPCYASLDEDNDPTGGFTIDGADLAQFLAAWGPHESCEKADFNSDGVVNGFDLAMLLSEWGNCYCCEHAFPR